MNQALFNAYFWLGQFGLLLTTVAGLVLVIISNRGGAMAKPMYYYIPIWVVSLWSLWLFIEPFRELYIIELTGTYYGYRLIIGLAMCSVLYYYQRGGEHSAKNTNPKFARTITLGFAGGLMFGIIVMGTMAFRMTLERANTIESNYIIAQGKRYQVNPAIRLEFTRLYELHKSDSLMLIKQTEQIKFLQFEQLQNQREIKELVGDNRMMLHQIKILLQQQQQFNRRLGYDNSGAINEAEY